MGYRFYDPGTSNVELGTSSSNLFAIKNGVLTSSITCISQAESYVLSGIRKNN